MWPGVPGEVRTIDDTNSLTRMGKVLPLLPWYTPWPTPPLRHVA